MEGTAEEEKQTEGTEEEEKETDEMAEEEKETEGMEEEMAKMAEKEKETAEMVPVVSTVEIEQCLQMILLMRTCEQWQVRVTPTVTTMIMIAKEMTGTEIWEETGIRMVPEEEAE